MATAAVWISRVPTMFSLQQMEHDSESAPPAVTNTRPRPEAAVSDVLGAALPRVTFALEKHGYADKKRIRSFGDLGNLVPDIDGTLTLEYAAGSSDDEGVVPVMSDLPGAPQTSKLDILLMAEWEDRAEQGLFRYDVTACPCKVLPGPYGFVAQLNEGRASKKRPTEFRIDQVAQPFDSGKFNFCKALQKEVLFQFEPAATETFDPVVAVSGSPNLVFINVSPIEYGHVLLVPATLEQLPQLVSPKTMLLALHFAKAAKNAYFRLGFNSLGAYGTINHLHFQAYYLAAPFAIERAPTAGVRGLRANAPGGVHVSQLAQYPVRGLVFEASSSLDALADLVGTACERLAAANVPHNLFIADCGARVFLLPNAFAERKAKGEIPEDVLETQVDPAAFEICGHIVLKRDIDYENVTQASCWKMLEYASFSAVRFAEVVRVALPQLCLPASRLSGTSCAKALRSCAPIDNSDDAPLLVPTV